MKQESERQAGRFPPGRPGDVIESVPLPWIVTVAIPLGALLGLGLRLLSHWMGWR